MDTQTLAPSSLVESDPYHYLVGKKVRIHKGTRILDDTSPRPRERVERTLTVTVDHLLPASADGAPSRIRWAGSGGYWKAVAASEVELLW